MDASVAESPYAIVYVDDDTMWEGDTAVISAGVRAADERVAWGAYQV